jgi:hypothetical protein
MAFAGMPAAFANTGHTGSRQIVAVAAKSSVKPKAAPKKVAKPKAAKTAKPAATCNVKGNVSQSTKEKIYHVPGCPNYGQTVIETTAGERMFCSEAEARAAGWRKAGNCK